MQACRHVPGVVEALVSEEGERILQTREQEQVHKVCEPQQSKIGVVCGKEGREGERVRGRKGRVNF